MSSNKRKRKDILQDGETFRHPMQCKDSARLRIDGTGDRLGMHRPGYRLPKGINAVADEIMRHVEDDEIADAYEDYERDLCDAWKGDARRIDPDETKDPDDDDHDEDDDELEDAASSITGAGSKGFKGQAEGDLCTLNGRAGTRQHRGGKLVCVRSGGGDAASVAREHAKKMDALYQQRDQELRDAWKK
jgi:hypothetical protein